MASLFITADHSPNGFDVLLDGHILIVPVTPFSYLLELIAPVFGTGNGCLYHDQVISVARPDYLRKLVQRLREKGLPIRTCAKSYHLFIAAALITVDLRLFEIPRTLLDPTILHRLYKALESYEQRNRETQGSQPTPFFNPKGQEDDSISRSA